MEGAAMATMVDRYVVRAGDGTQTHLGGMGVTFKVPAAMTGGALAIVEHPVQPRALVPPHTHHREDELSFVVEGTFGVRIGDDEFEVGPGDYVYKPRGIPHAFWNPTDGMSRLVELLFPPDFERFFAQLGQAYVDGGGTPDPERLMALARDYELDFLMNWVPDLAARHGLTLIGQR
jgi:quercetin dioxygenase-like cupin family protein